MLRIVWIALGTALTAFRSRRDLLLEVLALRQQLAAFKARGNRPRILAADRVFCVVLRRLGARWGDVLVIVKPDTVARWHRAGLRGYGNWISRRRTGSGRPPVDAEVRELIQRMAPDNGWGARRIHGELSMLGFDVSERTVSRYLRGLHRRPEARQSWLTFLHNHREVIAALDFFVVFTVSFRLLYVLFVIRHGRRHIAHFNVTEPPTAVWVVQQLREAFPFDTAPKHFIFDRDSILSAEVVRAVKSLGMKPTSTAYRSAAPVRRVPSRRLDALRSREADPDVPGCPTQAVGVREGHRPASDRRPSSSRRVAERGVDRADALVPFGQTSNEPRPEPEGRRRLSTDGEHQSEP